jgi:PEP-CTERM motif
LGRPRAWTDDLLLVRNISKRFEIMASKESDMRLFIATCIALVYSLIGSTASASTFTFDTDPFAGTTVLTMPGRQIVGAEDFIEFSPATDIFALDATVFGVGNSVLFANDFAGNLPTSDVNVIVLETFDDDNNLLTPFLAGNAANLIAAQITTPGPGFFVYFNQNLDLPRLVFSTDLSDDSADLKILARMSNLTGETGRDAMQTFTASNFTFTTESTSVPEPSTLLLLGTGMFGAGRCWRRRR